MRFLLSLVTCWFEVKSENIPHILIIVYDEAGGDVAKQTQHKVEAVDDSDREKCLQVQLTLTKTQSNEFCFLILLKWKTED